MTDILRVAPRYGSGRSAVDRYGRKTHELVFNVTTDDPGISSEAVRADSRVVQIGDVFSDGYTTDADSLCVGVDVQRDPVAEKCHRVKATFSNEEPDLQVNPIALPPVWKPYFEAIDWYLPQDQRGQYYRNTAGDWLETPPPTKITVMGFKITRNEAAYNLFLLASWMESVNTDIWHGCSPGYVRLRSIEPGDEQKAFGITYSPMTYDIQIHPFGWQPWLTPSMGRRYKDSGGTLRLPAEDGVFQDQPILLDDAGDKLPDGDPPHLLEFYPLKERPFAPLGL